MEPKIVQFGNKGMHQDTSISKESNEFAFKNINIRITAMDDNTLLSITNERGPEITGVNLIGSYAGRCVLGDYTVIFTCDNDNQKNYIYKLYLDGEALESEVVYQGWLDITTPVEAIGFYENEEMQKVYWVDGKNQCRVINIAKSYTGDSDSIDTKFDFCREILSFPTISVEKKYNNYGSFPSGVIQYFVSYYNKYGAETNIVAATDINYISPSDRGGKEDEIITCSFSIKLTNLDTSFDYVRVYSARRTSLNGTIEAQIIRDYPLEGLDSTSEIVIEDTNINNEAFDATALYYIGASNFSATTIEQKDGTAFFGNINLLSSNSSSIKIDDEDYNLQFVLKEIDGAYNNIDTYYNYNQLVDSADSFRTFKCGEDYLFAVQLQDIYGDWSDPIFLKSLTCNVRPTVSNSKILLPSISFEWINVPNGNFVNYRLLYVVPTNENRRIIAQGIISPTMFNLDERFRGTTFAIPSWISRPIGGNALYGHYENVGSSEIQISDGVVTVEKSGDSEDGKITSFTIYLHHKHKYNTNHRKCTVVVTINRRNPFSGLLGQPYVPVEKTKTYDSTKSASALYDKMNRNSDSDCIIADLGFMFDTIISQSDFLKLWNEQYAVDDQFTSGSAGTSWTVVNNTKSDDHSAAKTTDDIQGRDIDEFPADYFVDNSILTLNSPDIQYSKNTLPEDVLFRTIGYVEVKNNYCASLLEVSNPLMDTKTIRNLSEYTGGNKLINSDLYLDGYAKIDDNDANKEEYVKSAVNHKIYMWHKTNSIIGQKQLEDNQTVPYAKLSHKVFANLTYCGRTIYDGSNVNIGTQSIKYWDSEGPSLVRFKYCNNDVYYSGDIDRLLVPDGKYYCENTANIDEDKKIEQVDACRVKFKSGKHAIISLEFDENSGTQILVPVYDTEEESHDITVNNLYWGDFGIDKFSPARVIASETTTQYLLLGEIYRENQDPYGDITKDETIRKFTWTPISNATPLSDDISTTDGDTYFQRYDCLKTYPMTEEDENSVVDITSFMVETHVNLDGRDDVNSGVSNILNARPSNFGLLNTVYEQQDNIFSYNILDERFDQDKFKNQIAWSLTKAENEYTDTWANIDLVNTLNIDGRYGRVVELTKMQDTLIFFQERAIGVINYNNRTQISTEQGIPIELANSGKVNGYSYITTHYGCQNKHSIVSAKSGLYFIDNNNMAFLRLSSEGVQDISTSAGMSIWFKHNIENKSWTTIEDTNDVFFCHYDSLNGDIYIIKGGVYTSDIDSGCIVYNEKIGTFISFMPYDSLAMFNINNKFFQLKLADNWMYEMFAGNYSYPYSVEYRINPEPLTDKTFTNLEYIADITDNGVLQSDNAFEVIRAWNEYQDSGNIVIKTPKYLHKDLATKFRIRRVDIPRDAKGDNNRYGLNRMRNPWIHLKLSRNTIPNKKMTFHSLIVKYYK